MIGWPKRLLGGAVRKSVPTVLQMETVECGAACLGMILAYYGRWVPLEELRVACGVSRNGAKASNVVKAARSYGLDAQGRKLEIEETRSVPTPFVAFWGFNHFVVVEKVGASGAWINDPASGPRRVDARTFDQNFTGVALEFKPTADFQRGGHRAGMLRSIWPRLHGSHAALGYIATASLLLILPGIVLPAAMKTFVDDVLIRGFENWIFPLLIGVVLAGVASALLTILQQRHLLRLQTKLGIATAAEFFDHVLKVPLTFYAQRYVGDVASRVQSCHRLAQLLAGPLPTNLVHCVSAIFFLAVMAIYSVELTLIAAGLTLLNLLVVQGVRRVRETLNAVMLNQRAQLSSASMVMLQAIETLKASGAENDALHTWAGYQTNTTNTNQRMGRLSSWASAAPGLLEHLTTAAVLGFGAWLIINGDFTIGGLIAFQLLMGHFTTPINAMVGFAGQIQEIRGDLVRLDDVLRYPKDPALVSAPTRVDDGAPHLGSDGDAKLSGRVELRQVTFGYSPLEDPLVSDFDLVLEPGRRVALVGGSGSGKSTVVKMILGLYPPGSGSILYDGKPIDRISRPVFTSSVASVDQDIFLFEGTIAENLSLWDDTIPREALVRAAKDADIYEMIAARPGGFDSMVAEGGANFSGGQRQRLEIARALVRNPTLLILDEATSALDPTTEKTIDDNLRRRGCACIIVAHRLSTIRDSDEIVVLDRGHVVERGTHEALIAAKRRYADLVALQ